MEPNEKYICAKTQPNIDGAPQKNNEEKAGE